MSGSGSSRESRWDPEGYARHAGFVPKLGEPLVALLDPRSGERILDLGCGDGALTVRLAEAGAEVLGVDSSPEQVEAARARGLRADVLDAAGLPFEAAFEAVFSNATLHWIKAADSVLAGVHRALVPGGRFVAEFGGAGNVDRIRQALHRALRRRDLKPEDFDPWFFPTADDYRGRLERAGFRDMEISLFERPTPLPTDLRGWMATFAQPFMAAVAAEGRTALVDEVVEDLAAELRRPDGSWWADYVRLRVRAVRP